MNFPTETAVRIREAINDTIRQLQPAVIGPGLPEPTRAALQAHLDALLKEELRALTGQALMADFTEKFAAYIDPRKDPEPTPWYPDDSGEWMEVPDDCTTCPCTPSAIIEILVRGERHQQVFRSSPRVAQGCLWDNDVGLACRIVAYKVVKP